MHPTSEKVHLIASFGRSKFYNAFWPTFEIKQFLFLKIIDEKLFFVKTKNEMIFESVIFYG